MSVSLALRDRVSRITQDYPAIIFLLILSTVFALSSERFLTVENIGNIGRQTALVAILAIGLTFTMLTGGIDLSIGSTVALSGAMCAWAATNGAGTYGGIAIGLLCGLFLGAVNAVLVSKLAVVPFVATLATLTAYRSVTLLLTDGRPIAGLERNFRAIANSDIFGVPTPFVIAVVIAVVAHIWLSKTSTGLLLYAVGGHVESARLAGLNIAKALFVPYLISGLCGGIGGVLLTSRVASAQPNAASGIELDAITAAVLGGVSLFGGKGKVAGAITGAVTLTVLANGLNLLQVDAFIQQIAKGVALLVAVLISTSSTGSLGFKKIKGFVKL